MDNGVVAGMPQKRNEGERYHTYAKAEINDLEGKCGFSCCVSELHQADRSSRDKKHDIAPCIEKMPDHISVPRWFAEHLGRGEEVRVTKWLKV